MTLHFYLKSGRVVMLRNVDEIKIAVNAANNEVYSVGWTMEDGYPSTLSYIKAEAIEAIESYPNLPIPPNPN